MKKLLFLLLLFPINASAITVCKVVVGCTGTSSIPVYGQLLAGDGALGYKFFATSSLFQTANASLSGLLSSTDWGTFNNKQASLSATYPAILTGTVLSYPATSTLYSNLSAGGLYISAAKTVLTAATTTITPTSPITSTYAAGTWTTGCATCLTGNQTITLSGAVSGSGATAITTSYAGILGNTLGGTGLDSSAFSGLVGTNGGIWYAKATSTLSCTGAVSCAPTGVSGVASSVNLASIAANSVMGTQGASGVPSAIATSSLFQTASASLSGLLSSTDWGTFNGKQASLGSITGLVASNGTTIYQAASSTLYGTGTSGQVLSWSNGLPLWSATATCVQITGSSALCDGDDASGGGGFAYPFPSNATTTTLGLQQLTFTNATGTSIYTSASSTIQNLNTSNLCIVGDCKTAWPASSGGAYPFSASGKNATTSWVGFGGGLAIGTTTQGIYALDVRGRMSQTMLPSSSCKFPWMSGTALTADAFGSATIIAPGCRSTMEIDVNVDGTILAPSSSGFASGTPQLQSMVANPTANFASQELMIMKSVGEAGSATSTNGQGVAMELVAQTPNVGTATTSIQYIFGFSTSSPAISFASTLAYSRSADMCVMTASSTQFWILVCRKGQVETNAVTTFATSTTVFKAHLILDQTGFNVYVNDNPNSIGTVAFANVPVVRLNEIIGVLTTATSTADRRGAGVSQGKMGVRDIAVWDENYPYWK